MNTAIEYFGILAMMTQSISTRRGMPYFLLLWTTMAIQSFVSLRLLLPYLAAATNTNTDFERLMSQPIPYGVAIAAGGLLVAMRLI